MRKLESNLSLDPIALLHMTTRKRKAPHEPEVNNMSSGVENESNLRESLRCLP